MSPRFALRFKDATKLAEIAKTHGYADTSRCGRWRVDGLLPAVGAAGAMALLESKGWKISEFLYFGSCHGVISAESCGPTTPLHCQSPTRSIQDIRFKAFNSVARKLQEEESKKGRASSTAKAATVASFAQSRTNFLRQLQSSPASPRVRRDEDKRGVPGKTGETPPSQKQRDA